MSAEQFADLINRQYADIGLDIGVEQTARFIRKALQGCAGITLGATSPVPVIVAMGRNEPETSPSFTALGSQIGGSHYKDAKIQHVEFCQINQLTWCESSAMKYLMRHRKKNKVQDVDKAIHYCLLLREIEYPEAQPIDLPIGKKS